MKNTDASRATMVAQKGQPSIYANRENLLILMRVRWVAIGLQLILILIGEKTLGIDLPLSGLLACVAGAAVLQFVSHWRLQQNQRVRSSEVVVLVMLDCLQLAAVLYLSGGAHNPFTYLLLVYLALATMMLKPKELVAVAALQVALYSLVNYLYVPLKLSPVSPLSSFHLHMAGMWVNFGFSVALIAVFGLLTRQSMLNKEQQLQRLREQQLKDEQVLALGVMSAGAAHELNTPLATMAILLEDLASAPVSLKDSESDLQILKQQVTQCRQIIHSLGDRSQRVRDQLQSSKQAQDTRGRQYPLQAAIDNWLVFRPQVKLKQTWAPELAQMKMELPLSVEQAILNLLDNAADASLAQNQDSVSLECGLQQGRLTLSIVDQGAGIPDATRQLMGAKIQASQKPSGLGWGLFLSNASIERAGGQVMLQDREQGGTLTKIYLPIDTGSQA